MPAAAQLTESETHELDVYKIMMQQQSIAGIKVSVKREFWRSRADFDELSPVINGSLVRWVNKKEMTVSIDWEDGRETEPLRLLLQPQFDFKLTSNAVGGAPPQLRGTAAPAPARAETVVEVNYKTLDNAVIEQAWTVLEEEHVTDRRTEARYPATLKGVDVSLTGTPLAMFRKVAMPKNMVAKMVKFINMRLSGITHGCRTGHRYTTEGEVYRLLGYMLAVAQHQHITVEKLWSLEAGEDDVAPAMALGRYGMGVNRFKLLKSLMWQYWDVDQSNLDKADPSRYIVDMEKDFNEHYENVYTPSALLNADESMSPYDGQVGDPDSKTPADPKLLFHQDFVPRKPKPLGKEIKDVADACSGVIIRIDYQRGKAAHDKQEYFSEYGHTIAQSLRLTKPWHHTGRIYGADSWFMGLRCVEALADHGIYGFGDVKTNTSGFPTKHLQEHCGEDPGDWITLRTNDYKGRQVIAVGHRRGPSVHTFISAHGTTIPGKPQSHCDEIDESGKAAVPRKCPKVLNDYTLCQPHIDVHNRYRQETLAIEEAFRTESFPLRFLTTLIGMIAVNCFKLSVYFHDDTRDFSTYITALSKALMMNTLDEASGSPAAAPGSGAPGALSPARGINSEAHKHRLVPLKLAGWRGHAQPRCGICHAKTTHCCLECSTPWCCVALCKPEHKYGGVVKPCDCLKQHQALPDVTKRATALPAKPAAGKKRGRDY